MDGRTIVAVGVLGAGGLWLWSRSPVVAAPSLMPQGAPGWPQGAAIPAVGYVPSQAQGVPRLPQGAPPLPPGSGAQLAGQTALGAGTAVAGAAAVGGSIAAAAITAGVGAVAALFAWGIGEKGWFRGGEEGVKVNPARDRFLENWGPRDVPWEQTGAHRLAADLTTMTGQPDGSPLWSALMTADTMEEFRSAVLAIQAEYAKHGIAI